jgi:hypothetical protein
MPLPAFALPITCSLYRPFGATMPTATGIRCRLVADLRGGRTSADGGLFWSHYLIVDETVDVRDGCSRTPGANIITYADGDEVRIPDASGTRYVVVWVEWVSRGTPRAFKRVYLLRHAAAWTSEV